MDWPELMWPPLRASYAQRNANVEVKDIGNYVTVICEGAAIWLPLLLFLY
jgi:hypothetical protein